MQNKKNIICLTPVRNESWILENFLKCASLWADYIIISDQGSSDGSQELIKKYPKAKLITNPYIGEYDEWQVRNILFEEARKIEGENIFLAVDADEVLTWDFSTNPEWETIQSLNPGTVIKCDFVNLMPDFKYYWDGPLKLFLGFIDDGSPFICDKIHTSRMIAPDNASVYKCNDIKIMHFQYTDWERMKSKHRWYQCWERLNRPENSKITIYRSYHHMYSVKKSDVHLLSDEWFENYYKSGIDLKEIRKDESYYWDKIVLEYLDVYGTEIFKLIDIWDIDWVKLAKKYGFSNPESFKDPRNIFDKLILFWLKKTQYNHYNFLYRVVDKILIKIFKV